MTYRTLSDLDFVLESLPNLAPRRKVVMTSPEHFDVMYVINAHMAGNIGSVDSARAREQWANLRDEYRRCSIPVLEVEGIEGQPDMVFCANQTLPFLNNDGSKGVVLSKMYAPERAGEVVHFAEFFAGLGYQVLDGIALGDSEFEGMGDALWHSGKRLLWGGYGFRTDESVYRRIGERLDTRVLLLKLEDPDFYHLDTCLCILDERTALIYPGAFGSDGLALIRKFFPRIIEAPEDEARNLFACNAHSPDGKHVIIQRGCLVTNAALREAGFDVIEVDTDEFLKSGGSVFCMKLMIW